MIRNACVEGPLVKKLTVGFTNVLFIHFLTILLILMISISVSRVFPFNLYFSSLFIVPFPIYLSFIL